VARPRDILLLLAVFAVGALGILAPAAYARPGLDIRPRALGAGVNDVRNGPLTARRAAAAQDRATRRAAARRKRRATRRKRPGQIVAGALRPGVARVAGTPAAVPAPVAPAEPAAAPVLDAAAPPAEPAAQAPVIAEAAPVVPAVSVTVDETPDYVALLSRPSVPAGQVRIQLQNAGEDPHNLRVMREDGTGEATDFAVLDPGAHATRTLSLTAGRYRLFCTLTAPVSHDAAGMSATLDVSAG
jgi:hypothetical protein